MSLMEVAMRRASGHGLAPAMAALAATVTAIAVFLMPAGVLEQAVLASGMADVLAPLNPPLGLKARAGLSLMSAGSAFGMVLMLMRLIDAAPKARASEPEEEEAAAPRLRRRDRHPDAPARAPFSVSRDLAAPASAEEPEPEAVAPPPALRVRTPDTRRRAPLIEILGAAQQESEAAPAEAAQPPRRIKAGRETEPVEAERVEAAEPRQPEPAADEAAPEPVIAAPAPDPPPVDVAEPAPPVAPVRPAAPAPAAPAAAKEQDLSELMARLEQAMERKTATRRAAAAADAGEEAEDSTDVRLRSALENLKRFAPRHG